MRPKKDQVLKVRVDKSTYSAVEQRSKKARRTISDYVRIVIEDHCAKREYTEVKL